MHADRSPESAATPPDEADLREARQHVKRLRDFHLLLLVALIVTAVAGFVDLATVGRPWIHWVVLGFGIALAFSALDTFGRDRWLGRRWQERKLRAYLDRRSGA